MRGVLGIKIFGVLFGVLGGIFLMVAAIGVTIKRDEWEWFPDLAILPLAMGLVLMAQGIGLLLLRGWARKLALIGASIVLLICVASVVMDPGFFQSRRATFEPMFGFVSMSILSAWTLWYFLRPSVKAQFVRTATSDK